MRFKTSAKMFGEKVDLVSKVCPRKPEWEELRMVKLDARKDDTVVITATNREIGVEVMVPAVVEESGTVLVLPKDITQTTKIAGDDEWIKFALADGRLSMSLRGTAYLSTMQDVNGLVSIERDNENSTFVPIPIDADEIKALSVTCDTASVLPMNSSLHVISKDGVLSMLTIGGANSWMTYLEKPYDEQNFAINLPFEYMQQTMRMEDFNAMNLRIQEFPREVIATTGIATSIFPVYGDPKDFSGYVQQMSVYQTIEISRDVFLDATERVKYYTGDKNGMYLHGDNTSITVSTINGTPFETQIPITTDKNHVEIACNAIVMHRMLKSVEDGFTLKINNIGKGKIIELANGNFSHYILPMAYQRSE